MIKNVITTAPPVWEIIRHNLGYGLSRGFLLGFLYGPISIVLLVAFNFLEAAIAGTASSSNSNFDMLRIYLWTACFGGSLLGIIIGLCAGLLLGFILAAFGTIPRLRSVSMVSHKEVISAIGAAAVGLVALWVTSNVNFVSLLAHDQRLLGTILWVAIPTLLASISGWVSSYRAVKRLN